MSIVILKINITDSMIARHIKKRDVADDGAIQPSAFDLRDCTPPEEYLSFFVVDGGNDVDSFSHAEAILSGVLRPPLKGYVALLEVSECLEFINTDDELHIEFTEENLPHCGLHYLCTHEQTLYDIKSTLAYLASHNYKKIQTPRLIKD